MPEPAGLDRRKVLVTGASGFIGRRLVEKLAGVQAAGVTALVRNPGKARLLRAAGVRPCVSDLSRPKTLDEAVPGHDTVINLAHDFKRSLGHNLANFNNLVDACLKHGVRHFVHVSSIVVYDDWPSGDVTEKSPFGAPGTEYKNTKVAIEKRLLQVSEAGPMHSTILQPTIVYGPHSWLWTDHVVEKLSHGTIIFPEGCEGICNAVYVDDVVDALLLAAARPGLSGEKFIISGRAPPTWREFYERHNRWLGTDAIKYVDRDELAGRQAGKTESAKNYLANPLLLANLKPVRGVLNFVQRVAGEKPVDYLRRAASRLGGAAPAIYYPSASELEQYCSGGICCSARAERLLGYTPRFDFDAGFERTAEYLREKQGRP